MSHYSINKIRIRNPDTNLFEQVLEKMAEKLGGKLVKNTVVRGWGFSKQVDYLIEMELPYGNGYGIEIASDGIIVHVDDHGAPVSGEEFANMLSTEYTKQALISSLEELGYGLVAEGEDEEKIEIVVAESWRW